MLKRRSFLKALAGLAAVPFVGLQALRPQSKLIATNLEGTDVREFTITPSEVGAMVKIGDAPWVEMTDGDGRPFPVRVYRSSVTITDIRGGYHAH